MSDEQQDSFELFADTLTITLGCIIFIALLLVTITRSHQLDKSGLFHVERRSELLSRQIEIANAESPETHQALKHALRSSSSGDKRLHNYEQAAARTLRQFLDKNGPQYGTAMLSENIRSQMFLTKFPWMLQAIEQNIGELEERIDRAFSQASETTIAYSLLRESAIEAPVPAYILLYNGKIYPVPGGPGRDYEHIKWTQSSGPTVATGSGKTWQLSANSGAGLDITDGIQYLKNVTAGMTRDSGSQIVLLVYADSFKEARVVLGELSRWNVNFSWRAFEEGRPIMMAEGGLPPESPL